MSNGAILAIDQGTTNTKASWVDAAGHVQARAAREITTIYPQPGWVEQDPLAIWESVRAVIAECLAASGGTLPVALAITNQRESVLWWERRTGKPLGPVAVWQCRRSTPLCDELRKRGLEPMLRARTGLTIDPLFSASKARWLLDHIEGGQRRAEDGELCVGTIDSWVLWNLTGGAVHACDVGNAARTQLLNIHDVRWDTELLRIFGLPAVALPEVRPSGSIFGSTATTTALPVGIPIAAMIADSHAALFGQAGFAPGSIKATYGTGSSLMMPVTRPIASEHGLSATIAWAHKRVTYALEGNISVTGAAVRWLGRFLGSADPTQEVAALAASVPSTEGVYFVPAFVGLGAPYWDENARGLISGVTACTTAAHVARAVIEAIAYQVRDVFEAMQADEGLPLTHLLTDGGASHNDLLMQFQADMIGRPVLRSVSPDVSALGAAYLAGLTVGLWRDEDEIAALPRPRDRFDPVMPEARRVELLAGWQRAVASTMFCSGRINGE